MDELKFKKLKRELPELISFMTNNHWEFHPDQRPSEKQIVEAFQNGWYQEGRETFWIENQNEKIGLIVIHDICDTIPLFDIRLANDARGKGYGTKAVKWLTQYIFSLRESKIRIEAHTRSDNLPMRKTLSNCSFVREGYFRQAWENADGTIYDSICYAIIRSDWENNVVTPIKLDELSF